MPGNQFNLFDIWYGMLHYNQRASLNQYYNYIALNEANSKQILLKNNHEVILIKLGVDHPKIK
jgi:hypothetical protein